MAFDTAEWKTKFCFKIRFAQFVENACYGLEMTLIYTTAMKYEFKLVIL